MQGGDPHALAAAMLKAGRDTHSGSQIHGRRQSDSGPQSHSQ
jgi:hypothetical protein